MRFSEALARALVLVVALGACGKARESPDLLPSLTVVSGAVNGALIERGEGRLVVYGDPQGTLEAADEVLVTHHRRDVVWAARALVEEGARATVPAGEIDHFTRVDEYWTRFADERFHDYAQQTTYGVQAEPGGTVRGSLVIMNHSPEPQEFRVELNLPSGWSHQSVAPAPVRIPPRQEGAVAFTLSVPDDAEEGLHIVTADLGWGERELREWTEMMVEIARRPGEGD